MERDRPALGVVGGARHPADPGAGLHQGTVEGDPAARDRGGVNAFPDLRETLLGAWRTSSLITTNLVENLPAPLWDLPVPGSPQRGREVLDQGRSEGDT